MNHCDNTKRLYENEKEAERNDDEEVTIIEEEIAPIDQELVLKNLGMIRIAGCIIKHSKNGRIIRGTAINNTDSGPFVLES